MIRSIHIQYSIAIFDLVTHIIDSSIKYFLCFFLPYRKIPLASTFTICYDHERKSPTAVYVEVTGPTVVEDIDKRPPFFTDKRVEKNYRTTSKDLAFAVAQINYRKHIVTQAEKKIENEKTKYFNFHCSLYMYT